MWVTAGISVFAMSSSGCHTICLVYLAHFTLWRWEQKLWCSMDGIIAPAHIFMVQDAPSGMDCLHNLCLRTLQCRLSHVWVCASKDNCWMQCRESGMPWLSPGWRALLHDHCSQHSQNQKRCQTDQSPQSVHLSHFLVHSMRKGAIISSVFHTVIIAEITFATETSGIIICESCCTLDPPLSSSKACKWSLHILGASMD